MKILVFKVPFENIFWSFAHKRVVLIGSKLGDFSNLGLYFRHVRDAPPSSKARIGEFSTCTKIRISFALGLLKFGR